MEFLPLETVQQIFAHACSDGGPTGASLSLVSCAFRSAVRPVRLHSVALRSCRSAALFLRTLRADMAVAEGGTPVVRHLLALFSTHEYDVVVPQQLYTCLQNIANGDVHFPCSASSGEASADQGSVLECVKEVLSLVGPSLETLTFEECYMPFSTLFSLATKQPSAHDEWHISNLRELTIVFDRRVALQLEGLPAPSPHPFTKLKRVHIVMINSMLITHVVKLSTRLAPQMTAVRLSHVEQGSKVEQWLRSMTKKERKKRPHPQISHIAIEPHPRPMVTAEFRQNLEQIRMGAPDDINIFLFEARKLQCTPEEWNAGREWYKRLEQEWIDRIEGGDGGWPPCL